MAIDTRQKRTSAISPGIPWRNLHVVPDLTLNDLDRLQAASMYAGLIVTFYASWFPGIVQPYVPKWEVVSY